MDDMRLKWEKPMTSLQAGHYHLTKGFVAAELYEAEYRRIKQLEADLVSVTAERDKEIDARIYAEKLLANEPCTIESHKTLEAELDEWKVRMKALTGHDSPDMAGNRIIELRTEAEEFIRESVIRFAKIEFLNRQITSLTGKKEWAEKAYSESVIDRQRILDDNTELRARHAALVEKAKVIVEQFDTIYHNNDFSKFERVAMKELKEALAAEVKP